MFYIAESGRVRIISSSHHSVTECCMAWFDWELIQGAVLRQYTRGNE